MLRDEMLRLDALLAKAEALRTQPMASVGMQAVYVLQGPPKLDWPFMGAVWAAEDFAIAQELQVRRRAPRRNGTCFHKHDRPPHLACLSFFQK